MTNTIQDDLDEQVHEAKADEASVINNAGPEAQRAYLEASELPEAPRCVYPDCPNSRRTRGVCHQHYQTMRSYVRDGKATEADLEARGLLLPKGGGGSPVKNHSAFLLGSDVRGEG